MGKQLIHKKEESKKEEEPICRNCGETLRKHYTANFCDGVNATKGILICPVSVFIAENYDSDGRNLITGRFDE